MIDLSISKKPYLLDQNLEKDIPLPIFKSIGQILSEHMWALIIFAALLVALLKIWKWKRKPDASARKTTTPPPIDPFEEAMRAFTKLESLQPRPAPKPYIFKLSEILRLYIERKFNLPAMEQTGPEFLKDIEQHPFLRKHFVQKLHEFVLHSDRIKYSSEKFQDTELLSLLETARSFVEEAQGKHEEEQRRMQEQAEKINS